MIIKHYSPYRTTNAISMDVGAAISKIIIANLNIHLWKKIVLSILALALLEAFKLSNVIIPLIVNDKVERLQHQDVNITWDLIPSRLIGNVFNFDFFK